MSNLFIDYAVFGLLIFATLSFNIYNNVSGPKEKTKADYVFATGRSVSTWAMLLSIARGFLGVRVFLGYPSELFYRGSEMWETMYGMVLAFPVVAYFFVPVYFSLGITSVYQYLDLRFNSRLVRCLASATYVVRSILNLGVTVFTPCVALKTVIGMPYWVSIIGITSIGVLLTIMGGLRSAIMADVIQGLAMIGCSVAVIIQGTIVADGPMNVIKKSYDRGRLKFFNFDLDPTVRVTTVTALIGQFFISLSLYGCQQNFVQRYLSMKTQNKVTRTLWYNVPFMAVLMSLSWVVGMVVFVQYADCDPKLLGYISDIDEILPFYIEDQFEFLPGFLGLTMACLFNGGLSFLVSNLNSISTVVWEDFLAHLNMFKKLTDKNQLISIKLLGAVLGICIMGVSFAVSYFSGVIESSMLMTSATSGPLLGVFILAMFFPSANWKGASVGMIASHIITLWITIGSLTIEKPPVTYLPSTTLECTNTTFSQHISPLRQSLQSPMFSIYNDTDILDDYKDQTAIEDSLKIIPINDEGVFSMLYRMTYMYYALVGTILTVVIGVSISYITDIDERYKYSETLIHPLARRVCAWFPGESRYYTTECKARNRNSDKATDSSSKVFLSMEKSSEPTVCYKNEAFDGDKQPSASKESIS